MAGGRIDRLGMARRGAVAAAIVRRAEVRPALEHLAGYPDIWEARIVAGFFASAARVFGNATRLRRVGFVFRGPEVRRPFPDIADHVVKAVAVRGKGLHRRGAVVSVEMKVVQRKIALPGVGHMYATGRKLVAPSELRAVKASACRKFPL